MGTLSFMKEARIYNEEKAGFSISGSNSKASAYNAGDPGVQSLGLEDLLEKEMANHSSILAWKNPMDGGARQSTVHGVAKSRT